jgi:hypothetical protein
MHRASASSATTRYAHDAVARCRPRDGPNAPDASFGTNDEPVDGATGLPEAMSVGSPGAETTLRYDAWAGAGRLHVLGEVDQLDPSGASVGTIRMEHARIAKRRRGTPALWFPTEVSVGQASRTLMTIRFEGVTYTPG